MPIPPYPQPPSPGTFTNTPVLVSALRDDVTSGVTFLANRPAFSAYSTGNASISADSFTPVVLDTEYFDTWAGHSPLGTYPQNYYCQSPGWYLAEGFVPWNYTGGSFVALAAAIGAFTAGGTAISEGQAQVIATGVNPGMFAADLVQLTRTGVPDSSGSDYLQLMAFTNYSSFTLQGTSPNLPTLSARWVGSGAASTLPVPANASFPVPPSYVDETWLDANVRDAVSFLSNPPMLRYTYAPGSQTISSGTWPAAAKITLGTSSLDNYSAWDPGSSQWIAPAAGVHYVYAQVACTSASGAAYAAGVTVNGTTTWGQSYINGATTSGTIICSMAEHFRFAAGDTVSLAGFQNAGSALSVKAQTRLCIFWESS
ncbi:MAG TPA: hypothetical protein VMV92_13205 [Streptosporangiaceae bacterium]|nr:hypothetical protein [Streptosporangiaceae bacterium]